MSNLIKYIKGSYRMRSYIILTLCFITALVIFMRYGKEKNDSVENTSIPSVGEPGHKMIKTGGLGATHEGDSLVEELIVKIKPTLVEKTGKQFDSIEPISYKKQVVAGTNYFIKAKAKLTNGEESFLHLRIFKNLRNETELTAFELDKDEHEDLKYFDK